MLLDHLYEVIVHDVLVPVILAVVHVDVLERVYIEIHLVVRTHPVMIYAQQGEIGKYVVYGCDGNFCVAVFLDFFCDHVGGSVSQFNNILIYCYSLWGRFQGMGLENVPELLYI